MRPCISTLWWGKIRWKLELENQKSWMGNISCLSPGNELDIQGSSSRIFSLLFVCLTRIEMKIRMSEESGLEILFDPLSWKYMQSSVGGAAGKKVNLTLFLSRDNVGFDIIPIPRSHILLKKMQSKAKPSRLWVENIFYFLSKLVHYRKIICQPLFFIIEK